MAANDIIQVEELAQAFEQYKTNRQRLQILLANVEQANSDLEKVILPADDKSSSLSDLLLSAEEKQKVTQTFQVSAGVDFRLRSIFNESGNLMRRGAADHNLLFFFVSRYGFEYVFFFSDVCNLENETQVKRPMNGFAKECNLRNADVNMYTLLKYDYNWF